MQNVFLSIQKNARFVRHAARLPIHHRLPGLLGLGNACFVSCFGRNSSSSISGVSSEGWDTSIWGDGGLALVLAGEKIREKRSPSSQRLSRIHLQHHLGSLAWWMHRPYALLSLRQRDRCR